MPYIDKSKREELDPWIYKLLCKLKEERWNTGCINYVISRILWEYFREKRRYQTINDIVGVLECVKSEFLRRKANDYEDEKIKENGDLKDTWYKI